MRANSTRETRGPPDYRQTQERDCDYTHPETGAVRVRSHNAEPISWLVGSAHNE